MTPNEFKAWLDGYTLAGGNDASVIAQKAQELTQQYYPYPYTVPDTARPWWQYPIVTCSSGTVSNHEITAVN